MQIPSSLREEKIMSFKTLLQEDMQEFTINKSRFLGYGCPCSCEEDALKFIEKIRRRHSDATHNCYAYIIGENSGIMRYSDDGEPGGTAGQPILEVLRKRGVVNCAVVVTRYFGGILLGAGGLVRAYTQGAIAALNASKVISMEETVRYLIEVDYSTWQRLSYFLSHFPCLTEQSEFGVTVVSNVLVREQDSATFLESVTRLSDGRAEILPEEKLFYAWQDPPAQS